MDTIFFVASKIFWGLARPESILVVLVVLGVLAPWRWMAVAARWLAAAAFLAIAALPVAEWAARPLETLYPTTPPTKDAVGILILGGVLRPVEANDWGTPEVSGSGERLIAGLMLAETHPEIRVVFTGGNGTLFGSNDVTEGMIAGQVLAGAGVAEDRITVETASRNTAENAAFTRDLLGDITDEPWILVTSAYHMPRSVETFCAAGWKQIIPYPVDFVTTRDIPLVYWRPAERLQSLNRVVKEWIGLLAYRWTGRADGSGACVFAKSG